MYTNPHSCSARAPSNQCMSSPLALCHFAELALPALQCSCLILRSDVQLHVGLTISRAARPSGSKKPAPPVFCSSTIAGAFRVECLVLRLAYRLKQPGWLADFFRFGKAYTRQIVCLGKRMATSSTYIFFMCPVIDFKGIRIKDDNNHYERERHQDVVAAHTLTEQV
jgi:hypothetical protein